MASACSCINAEEVFSVHLRLHCLSFLVTSINQISLKFLLTF
jgi:hypothetical protein